MLGYMCAYLRHYYPQEFIASLLNNSTTEVDTANGISLAQTLGIKISSPKFRYSKSSYMFDKENKVIYKGLSSIKFLSEKCADGLYSLKDNQYNTFIELLLDISKLEMDTRQLDILIKLEFFSEFGNIKELLHCVTICEFFKNGEAKQIGASKLDGMEYIKEIVERHSELTESGKTYRNLDMKPILNECYKYIKDQKIKDIDLKTKITWQQEFLGYISFSTGAPEDRYKLLVTEVKPLYTRDKSRIYSYVLRCMSFMNGKCQDLKVWSKVYDKTPLEQYDVIYVKQQDFYQEEYQGNKSWRINGYQVIKEELIQELV